MKRIFYVSCTIFDCVPINKPREAGIVYKFAEVVVLLLIVWDNIARDKLIIQLSEGQIVSLIGIHFDDFVYPTYKVEGSVAEVYIFVFDFRHCQSSLNKPASAAILQISSHDKANALLL